MVHAKTFFRAIGQKYFLDDDVETMVFNTEGTLVGIGVHFKRGGKNRRRLDNNYYLLLMS